ncbi:E3 ubiquitin-protein ligase TRIM33-like [Stylophora pistillata]|uniref:E3 ubiquitin-protein ligase TRIM33-like n=1 Tax=Stylophora pistillata TaxID=50429 RepID=UPI000C03A958|nr:E3 ubiquitin-protein ligase TRIM33-like [Stylophora pistillata]
MSTLAQNEQRPRHTTRCPKCQAISQVPESGDLKDLPTSFYLNGLIGVLTIKECKTRQVRCGNCVKRSSESSYCFRCCRFWCNGCIIGHNIIRSNKNHRVLVLKDFQDKDYEDVMIRPAFCPEEDYNKEELKYFCKGCEMPVCQICVTLNHGGHNLKLIKAEAETQKTEMNSFIENQRRNLQAKINVAIKIDQDCARLIQHGEEVKRAVQTIVDNLTAVIQAKKRNTFTTVEKELRKRKSIECIAKRKTEIERQITAIKSSLKKAEKLNFTRSKNAEVVQLKKSLDAIFEGVDQTEPTVRDLEIVAHSHSHSHSFFYAFILFVKNQKLFDTVKTEDIGTLKKNQQKRVSVLLKAKDWKKELLTVKRSLL